MVEDSFLGIDFRGAQVIWSPIDRGLEKLAEDVRRARVSLAAVKVLVVYVGRADVMATQSRKEYILVLEDFVATVKRFGPSIRMVLAGPIPRGTDSCKVIAKLVLAGRVVRNLCKQNEDLEFSRVAEEFITPLGVNLAKMLPDGASRLGKASIQSNFITKLSCVGWVK